MHGLTFLRKIREETSIPVVICSSLLGRGTDVALRALEDGAVDVVAKPPLGVRGFLDDAEVVLLDTVRGACQARTRRPARRDDESRSGHRFRDARAADAGPAALAAAAQGPRDRRHHRPRRVDGRHRGAARHPRAPARRRARHRRRAAHARGVHGRVRAPPRPVLPHARQGGRLGRRGGARARARRRPETVTSSCSGRASATSSR